MRSATSNPAIGTSITMKPTILPSKPSFIRASLCEGAEPRTPAGRARISEAQRERWRVYRESVRPVNREDTA